jgi:carboxyl-terminal processing protease
VRARGFRRGEQLIVVALLLGCGPSPSSPTSSTSGAAYVAAMIDIMQAHSVNRKTIDWTSFRSQVVAAVPHGAGLSDSYTAILFALELLGDNHSMYKSSSGHVLQASGLGCTAPTIGALAAVGPDLGYVRVAAFEGTGQEAQLFADALQSAIRAVNAPQLRGWIVDLRGNSGGNMWPMIAGIGPILGGGTSGYFMDPDDHFSEWGYNGFAAENAGFTAQAVTNPMLPITPAPRVAVLVDRRVASAGEAVAVAFKQRPNTRFFGTATCGLSTGNASFPLSDGATLVLTTAIMADRTFTRYGGPVQPDESIADSAAVVPAAVAWLRSSSTALRALRRGDEHH